MIEPGDLLALHVRVDDLERRLAGATDVIKVLSRQLVALLNDNARDTDERAFDDEGNYVLKFAPPSPRIGATLHEDGSVTITRHHSLYDELDS